MNTTRATRTRRLTAAAVLVLATGCGTLHASDADARPTPSAPTETTCPGEHRTPSASSTAPGVTPEPGDHYAENHGFRVPLQLRGRPRCAGLAVAARIEKALEPLRERGDFAPAHTRSALLGLGYPEGGVQTYQNGPTGVGFLVLADDTPLLCVDGGLDRAATHATAFGGYPDHSGCDMPSGGH
ncbi:hypothetical protein [Streptomyces sp. NPDC003717]|uniref:hypothetical protein n=1 Tax=Streptomyces sp. NPDC003717 TaxID=3154276 RepID=UPI0033BE2820